jgi:hypothetical protein
VHTIKYTIERRQRHQHKKRDEKMCNINRTWRKLKSQMKVTTNRKLGRDKDVLQRARLLRLGEGFSPGGGQLSAARAKCVGVCDGELPPPTKM